MWKRDRPACPVARLTGAADPCLVHSTANVTSNTAKANAAVTTQYAQAQALAVTDRYSRYATVYASGTCSGAGC
jgi:hypothetical protein